MRWIFFTDKNVDPEGRQSTQRLRPKTRVVRSAQSRNPDALDWPVSLRYVGAVAATGARVRHASRWFNAVSVQASPEQLEQIVNLPFVADQCLVARGRRSPEPKPASAAGWVNERAYPLDYGLSLMQVLPLQVPELHALGLTGRGVVIALLDSGFRLTHQAFDTLVVSGRVAGRWDFVKGDSGVANDTLDVLGQDYHGTEVLSTMAGFVPGELWGPAWGAAYLLAKTEDIATETPVEEDHYVAAIEWADSLGARVLSSSLSYDFGYTFNGLQGISTVAANTAASRGLLLVTAMGNSGPGPTTLGAPADAFDIISVGAVDAAGVIANFSSRGPTADGRIKPEVVAQGVSVYAVDPTQPDAYVLVNGTSFATPLTSSSAALLAEAHPDWTADWLREALMQSGDRSSSPGSDYGWGRFRLLAALDYQPAGAVKLRPHAYDAYDSSDWRLAVSAVADSDRRPVEVWVTYERVPGARDSVALTPRGDTLWETSLPWIGEDQLWWRVHARDSAGRTASCPPDPWRTIEMRRLPDSLGEDFEQGALRWTRGGTQPLWWPSAAQPYAGRFSLSDSPGGGYPSLCDAWFATALPVRVGTDLPWSLRFATRYQFGSGDSGKVEWKSTRDTSWQLLDAATGSQSDWVLRSYTLGLLPGDSVWLRFRLVSDAAVQGDGWYIDSVYLGGDPQSVDASDPKPSIQVLQPPTPNPFNHSTLLGFDLDRPAEVRLLVYDVLGRRVRTLWSGAREAGHGRLEWDGRDDRGRPLASGVYLARLELNDETYTCKMMLLK